MSANRSLVKLRKELETAGRIYRALCRSNEYPEAVPEAQARYEQAKRAMDARCPASNRGQRRQSPESETLGVYARGWPMCSIYGVVHPLDQPLRDERWPVDHDGPVCRPPLSWAEQEAIESLHVEEAGAQQQAPGPHMT